jgi:hypothetical protein
MKIDDALDEDERMMKKSQNSKLAEESFKRLI